MPRNDQDRDVRNDVVQALKWDALVNRNNVSVEVKDGRVTLTGTVGSAAEKARAITDAAIMGVKGVDATALEVAALLKQGDRTPPVITDEQIKKSGGGRSGS